MHLRKRVLMLACVCLLAGAALVPLTLAQGGMVITLTAPEWMQDAFSDEALADFEAQHGVDVVFVFAGDSMYYGGAAYAPEEFFDNTAAYAATADVLFVSNYNLSPEATRAGYFLDLSPLTSTDSSLNADDFFPAIWQSFQWDNGVWALPVNASLQLLVYNPAAFDEAGLAYPNENWTIDDFANAMRSLSKVNSQGEVTLPGMVDWGASGLLFRSLLGRGVFDDTLIPNPPQFTNNPELEYLVTTWSDLANTGYTGRNFSGSYDEVPMRLDGVFAIAGFGQQTDLQGALLPGGVAGLNVQGFAVSAGTQQPELAYELVKYLTSNARIINGIFGDTPARQSMVGVEVEDAPVFMPNLPDEVEALRDIALANALPASEMRYMEYISAALNEMSPEFNENGTALDAVSALQSAEEKVVANLQMADERRSTLTVMVATPVPTPVLSANEVALKFGLVAYISPLPNRERWDQAIADFVASEPQIGQVVLETNYLSPNEFNEEGYDCFMLPYNAVPDLNVSLVRSFDPFLNADPNFDPNDVLPGVMQQLQRDNLTWAYPLTIQPEILWYNTAEFDEAGVIRPENGWMIDEFNDALMRLRVDPEDEAPFAPSSDSNTYILMLMAAYGALPIDYRTTPPTLNFTAPETIEAARQVLDLAKQGYIGYNELSAFGGGFSAEQTIYNETLSSFSWRLTQNLDDSSDFNDPFQITTFPRGTQYSGVSFGMGTAYITANSANPEACYRFISHIAQRPELSTALPARRSHAAGFADHISHGEELLKVYNEIDALLQDPNTIVVPSQLTGGGSPGAFLLQLWLNKAFDAYVLEDADLEAELAEATVLANAYLECEAQIPPFDPAALSGISQEEQLAYFRQYTDCAVTVDPELMEMFSYMYQDEE